GLGVGAPAGGVHHDVTAARGQRQHDGAADVAAGAGDDRRVPAKAGRRRHGLAPWPLTSRGAGPASRITGGIVPDAARARTRGFGGSGTGPPTQRGGLGEAERVPLTVRGPARTRGFGGSGTDPPHCARPRVKEGVWGEAERVPL